MTRKVAALLAVLFVVCAVSVPAQEVTAGVYGAVQDSSGAMVPSATIRLRNVETGRGYQTSADSAGQFSISLLPIGTYEITAEAPGFKRGVVTDVTLRVNDNRRMVFSLDVGQVTETITVTAEAVAVNTSTGTTSQLMDGRVMVRLPSRGFVFPFALLMPGAISTTPYDRRNNNTSVNGIRPTHNAWLLDGGYNIDTGGNWGAPLAPNIETVAEFRAIRGNYNAEFGTGGGSQFNVITKSGTNRLHGSLYEFLRNDKLNSRNPFSPLKEPFRGNNFGGSLGGPVYIPKVYNGKDRTFFFAMLGWTEERRQVRYFQKLPELAYRTGDFRALGRAITDPLSGLVFPNAQIPASRQDRNALAYTKMYPNPNFLDAAGRNWTAQVGRKDKLTERNFRVDHNFSDQHRIFFRHTPEFRGSVFPVDPGFDFLIQDDRTPARNTAVNFLSTLRANLINEFNFVRSHNRIMRFPPDVSPARWGVNIPQLFDDSEKTYPLASLNLGKVPERVPGFSVVNYTGVSPSAPWSNYQSIFEFKDNLSWITGRHTLKTGFSLAYEKKFEPTNTNVFGNFTFDGRVTGDGWADFLLGRATNYTETDTVAFNDNRRYAFEVYVDDSFKATRRLTLNLGLRYSYLPPVHEPNDRLRAFVPSQYDPAKAVTVDSAGRVPRGAGDRFNGLVKPEPFWQVHKKNFAPRFSFAYDLFGTGRTSLRGGYGLFFSREILGAFILMSGNPPFSELSTIENTLLSSPGGGTARNYTLPIVLGSIDTNQLTPYTQQWNLNIQHSLTGHMVLEVGYSGSRGLHLMRTQDINQPLPNADIAQGRLNANQVRPYKGWGRIDHREQSYMSNYHGLQAGLNRHFARGISTQISYTWSKAIDNADFTGGIYGMVPNTRDSRGERGPANFDATHNFITSYIWEIPFLKTRRDLVGKAFGGWQVAGITTFQTGLPISPDLGRDIAGVGGPTRQRPATIRSPFVSKDQRHVNQWFDAGAYVQPAFGTFSPTSRNILRGVGWNNWDLSLAKHFRMTERWNLEFRVDGFNFFNHRELSGIGTSFFTPAAFGKVTSARNERSFILGMRIEF